MPYNVDIGDGDTALENNIIADALDGTYWVSGWDATLGTGDLEVDIAAGSGAIEGTDVSTGATQTIDFTGDPDSTDPRKAVIYVDGTGTVQKALGTPQPVDPTGEIRFRTWNPSPPASVSGVVVAEVWLAAGETVLESADVRDRRVRNKPAATQVSNTPNWIEDGNSPQSFTGASSVSYTLADTYDEVMVRGYIENAGGVFGLSLTLNGDTGANYNYVDLSGTNNAGESDIRISTLQRSSRFEFTVDGSWTYDCGFSNKGNTDTTALAVAGRNDTITSPLTSFEIIAGAGTNITGRFEVFGRNIG